MCVRGRGGRGVWVGGVGGRVDDEVVRMVSRLFLLSGAAALVDHARTVWGGVAPRSSAASSSAIQVTRGSAAFWK